MKFTPIAIIGRACLLPGANTPLQLWENVLQKKDCLTEVPKDYWKAPVSDFLGNDHAHPEDFTYTSRGGYVENFESLFNPTLFESDSTTILEQDTICQWLLHTGFQALQDANYDLNRVSQQKAGAIIGNLSYPTHGLSAYAESVWLNTAKQPAIHRFMSGYPVHFMAKILGLKGISYALDAACASSLYAIKLACDQLNAGNANLMLAGGINQADDLFLHIGFTALKALSKSGQSRPFHAQADGLVPAQGAAMVVLKRLEDAIIDKDKIHGVIRGIGLTNDGSQGGFLLPSSAGQIRAMEIAYKNAEINPHHVSWIDCHATGTPTGDRIEIESMQNFFDNAQPISIGALKANIGHTITASGACALINVLSGFEHQIKPPYRCASETHTQILQHKNFELLQEAMPWDNLKKARYAAINSFGFGGNNAHLIVQDWNATVKKQSPLKPIEKNPIAEDIAIVAIGVKGPAIENLTDFKKVIFYDESTLTNHEGRMDTVDLSTLEIRFPPVDLKNTLGQQLILLALVNNLLKEIPTLDIEKTSIFVGMQCDAEIARHGLRWRLATYFPTMNTDWLEKTHSSIVPTLTSAHVIGYMPNIVTNRLNHQFNFQAPSFSVSAEELSGIRALQIAVQALKNSEIDTAIVGAVDLCCEKVQTQAIKTLLTTDKHQPGDLAVALVLKRFKDAQKAGDKIYAILPADQTSIDIEMSCENSSLNKKLGYSHAANGLLHVACAAIACNEGFLFSHKASMPIPSVFEKSTTNIRCNALGEQIESIVVQKNPIQANVSSFIPQKPKIYSYSGNNRSEVLQALTEDPVQMQVAKNHAMKLAIIAHNKEELEKRVEQANYWLRNGFSSTLASQQGIYFQPKPIQGEMAFVFTCSMTSYPQMGLGLFHKFLNLAKELKISDQALQNYLQQIGEIDTHSELSILQELKVYSFLTQFHALLSRRYFNLSPHASIGYCAGETNALFALGAWENMPALHEAFIQSKIYENTLHGSYNILNENWPKNNEKKAWQSWQVIADYNDVQIIVNDLTNVHLTMINSPKDCVISGDPKACKAAIQRLGCPSSPLAYSIILHCPEFSPAAKLWHHLHLRKTVAVPNIRFYSTGTGKSYPLSEKNVADALVAQARNTVNFPRVIHNAWQEGVRIFIEHGPRSLCQRWVKDTLGDKEHLVVSMDVKNRDPITQLAHVNAALFTAGVTTNSSFFVGTAHEKIYDL
jgi:acyl transferase domain-containing protein